MAQTFKGMHIYQNINFDDNAETQIMYHLIRPKCIAITNSSNDVLIFCLFKLFYKTFLNICKNKSF